MANEELITLEQFAKLAGVNKDRLKNLRVKMCIPEPKISPSAAAEKNLYDKYELMCWLACNDIEKVMYEANTGKPFDDRHKRYIRKQKKAPKIEAKQPSSMIMAFLMGKYDHPDKRHADELKLDKARISMPKTTKVVIYNEAWIK